MSMPFFSSPLPTTIPTFSIKTQLPHTPKGLTFLPKINPPLFLTRSSDGLVGNAAVEEKGEAAPADLGPKEEESAGKVESLGSNGSAVVAKFSDSRWVSGTWDLERFKKGGVTDWDAVIDAEVRRRKWLQDNPETSSNDDPIVFDTSIIPWWSWVKRFHLPEAELINGRAAMVGFFMSYLVDSLTGVGLVDQMGNFFCKTLLFIAVVGVLLIRKNDDLETLKKLFEETTFYDKQWQATWQDNTSGSKKE